MSTLDAATNTKAGRIAEAIAQDITQGRYTPGMMLPGERELARSYDVSPVTVRKSLRLLSETGRVVRHPQRGVIVPGQTEAKRKVRQIAFITSWPNNGTNEWARGISMSLDPEQYALGVYSAYMDMSHIGRLVASVLATQPAGIIISPMADQHGHIDGAMLAESGIPVVTLGQPTIPGFQCDRIDESGVFVGKVISQFVLKRGFRDVVYFTSGPKEQSVDTIRSLRQHLGTAGISLPDERVYIYDAPNGYITPPDPYIDARREMARMLANGFSCELLIAGHDFPAVGALQSLLASGIQVPEQMHVMSGMRCPVEGVTPMKLTTIDFNRVAEGQIAADVLMRRIDGYTGPVEVHHVALDLIEGETT